MFRDDEVNEQIKVAREQLFVDWLDDMGASESDRFLAALDEYVARVTELRQLGIEGRDYHRVVGNHVHVLSDHGPDGRGVFHG